jgi:hypothetical protein
MSSADGVAHTLTERGGHRHCWDNKESRLMGCFDLFGGLRRFAPNPPYI